MPPTVHTRVHILADRPTVHTDPEAYPSVNFSENSGEVVDYTTVILTITGDTADRRAFADELRRAADFIETWERPGLTPVDEADGGFAAQVPA